MKVGDDIVFVEKKFVFLKDESLEPATKPTVKNTAEEFTVPAVNSISGVANIKEDDDEEEDDESILSIGDGDEEFTFSLDDLDFTKKADDDDDHEDDDDDDDDDDDHEEDDDQASHGEEKPSYFVSEPEPTNIDVLRAKLKKSMQELEGIRGEMKNTFTSTDTISNTITSLKGMLDALKRDQEKLK